MDNSKERWQICVYWVFGLFLVNILVTLKNIRFEKSFSIIYFSFILPMFLLFILKLVKRRYLSISVLNRSLLIILIGVIHSFVSGYFFNWSIGIIFSASIFVSIVFAIINYFDNFDDLKTERSKLEFILFSGNLTEKDREKYLQGIILMHEDAKYWFSKVLSGLLYTSMGIITGLSIFWWFAKSQNDIIGFYKLFIVIILIYIYCSLGFFKWVVHPLIGEIKSTRNIYLR